MLVPPLVTVPPDKNTLPAMLAKFFTVPAAPLIFSSPLINARVEPTAPLVTMPPWSSSTPKPLTPMVPKFVTAPAAPADLHFPDRRARRADRAVGDDAPVVELDAETASADGAEIRYRAAAPQIDAAFTSDITEVGYGARRIPADNARARGEPVDRRVGRPGRAVGDDAAVPQIHAVVT